MNSLATRLKQSDLFSLGIALIFSSILLAYPASQAQQLQQGVSVTMAITANAQPMPAADDEDAWVVAVTADGNLFFGTHSMTESNLIEKMKTTPRRRDQNLYIKADARARFADVKKALQAAREDSFEAPVLLTAQHEHLQAGTMVPPKGLEVLLTQPALGSEPTVVQVRSTAEGAPRLEVNNHQIPLANLQNTLAQLFQNRTEKVVALSADSQLPFAQVAQVIDACRSAGAKVILPTPEL